MSALKQIFSGQIGNIIFRNYLKAVGVESHAYYRHLYSSSGLGVDTYVKIREKMESHFGNTQDRFKSKMIEFSDPNTNHMIFTEDLKSMVHLASGSEDDLKTIRAMMLKFNKQNKEVRFGSFIFGPVIMRMYYYLNKPLEALEVFKDENLSNMFDQLVSYQILMDLLFNNQLYDEVCEVFEMVKSRQLQVSRFPKNCVVLYFGACYKLNTPESFKLASKLWQELRAAGHHPTRRASTFAAGLALLQNAPHIALEIISIEQRHSYYTVRSIKALALADLGRPEDVLPILRSILQSDDPQARKGAITNDVMERIRKSVERTTDADVKMEFERLEKQLIAHDMISNETLDSYLLLEIKPLNNQQLGQRGSMLSHSYNRRSANVGVGGGSSYQLRPGLEDMN